jgi:hypothetical protein
MDEISRIFRHFFGRDLIYIMSGTVPLLCLVRLLDPLLDPPIDLERLLSLSDVSTIWIVLAAGTAYVLAYAGQELACLLRITSTAIDGEPSWLTRALYRLYQHRPWEDIPPFDTFAAERRVDRSDDEREVATFERYVSLLQLGTVLGPSSFASGIALLAWLRLCPQQHGTFLDVIAGAAALVLGVIFLVLGWLKRAQLREYLYREFREDRPHPQSGNHQGAEMGS